MLELPALFKWMWRGGNSQAWNKKWSGFLVLNKDEHVALQRRKMASGIWIPNISTTSGQLQSRKKKVQLRS